MGNLLTKVSVFIVAKISFIEIDGGAGTKCWFLFICGSIYKYKRTYRLRIY